MSISHWGIFPGGWMRYLRDSKPRFWQVWTFDGWDGWQSSGDNRFVPLHDPDGLEIKS